MIYLRKRRHLIIGDENELIVFKKAKMLSKLIFDITELSPKKFRFTIVTRMQNASLDIVSCLYAAKNGIDYLGFHSYITESGKIIRRIRKKSKDKMKRRIKHFNKAFEAGEVSFEAV